MHEEARADRYMVEKRRRADHASTELAKQERGVQKQLRVIDFKRRGIQKDLERDEADSDAKRMAHAYTKRVRTWRRDVREELSGMRLRQKASPTRVVIFDLLISKFTRKGKPNKGVEYSLKSLIKSAKSSERTVERAIRDLKKCGYIQSKKVGLGKGQGWSIRRYAFPAYPSRAQFEAEWIESYGRLDDD